MSRTHIPAGAGDRYCRGCGERWPCPAVRSAVWFADITPAPDEAAHQEIEAEMATEADGDVNR